MCACVNYLKMEAFVVAAAVGPHLDTRNNKKTGVRTAICRQGGINSAKKLKKNYLDKKFPTAQSYVEIGLQTTSCDQVIVWLAG